MIIQSVTGLLVFAGLAWLMSENRKKAPIKMAVIGIVLQLAQARLPDIHIGEPVQMMGRNLVHRSVSFLVISVVFQI